MNFKKIIKVKKDLKKHPEIYIKYLEKVIKILLKIIELKGGIKK